MLALLLIWFIVTGFSNAVNLADGLDGLATGASILIFAAYTLVNIWQNSQSCALEAGPKCYEVRDPLDLAVVAAALTGACFGFLWWNASPAQIILGDTGSLALGGAMAGFAIMTRTELLLRDHRRALRGHHPLGDDPGLGLQGQPRERAVPEHLQGPARPPRLPDDARCTTTSRCSAGSRSPS